MAAQYLTKENDRLDHICWQYYQELAETATVLVLEANQNLANHGEHLPAGLVITLPSTKEVEKAAALKGILLQATGGTVKLWD